MGVILYPLRTPFRTPFPPMCVYTTWVPRLRQDNIFVHDGTTRDPTSTLDRLGIPMHRIRIPIRDKVGCSQHLKSIHINFNRVWHSESGMPSDECHHHSLN